MTPQFLNLKRVDNGKPAVSKDERAYNVEPGDFTVYKVIPVDHRLAIAYVGRTTQWGGVIVDRAFPPIAWGRLRDDDAVAKYSLEICTWLCQLALDLTAEMPEHLKSYAGK
jgi:hypothetical protein